MMAVEEGVFFLVFFFGERVLRQCFLKPKCGLKAIFRLRPNVELFMRRTKLSKFKVHDKFDVWLN